MSEVREQQCHLQIINHLLRVLVALRRINHLLKNDYNQHTLSSDADEQSMQTSALPSSSANVKQITIYIQQYLSEVL